MLSKQHEAPLSLFEIISFMLDDQRGLLPHQITQLKKWADNGLTLCKRDTEKLATMFWHWMGTKTDYSYATARKDYDRGKNLFPMPKSMADPVKCTLPISCNNIFLPSSF